MREYFLNTTPSLLVKISRGSLLLTTLTVKTLSAWEGGGLDEGVRMRYLFTVQGKIFTALLWMDQSVHITFQGHIQVILVDGNALDNEADVPLI